MDAGQRWILSHLDIDGTCIVGIGYTRDRHLHLGDYISIFAAFCHSYSQNDTGVEKTLIGHATIPLIIYGLFHGDINLVALLLGSGFPNFDVFPTLLRKKTPEDPINETHASTILHTIFLYIVILPVFYFILNGFGMSNSLGIAISFSLGGIIHVLSESFDEKGRRLLYPLSKKFYGIKILPYDFWTYVTNKKVLALEAALFMAALILLLAK